MMPTPDTSPDALDAIIEKLRARDYVTPTEWAALRAVAAEKRAAEAGITVEIVQAMADDLFATIKHGDDQHQSWLRQQALFWAHDYLPKLSAALALRSKDAQSGPVVPCTCSDETSRRYCMKRNNGVNCSRIEASATTGYKQ